MDTRLFHRLASLVPPLLLLGIAASQVEGGIAGGSVSGKAYTSDFLKLSYEFPAEWILQEQPSTGTVGLLKAQIGPVRNPSATVTLSAQKISGAGDSLEMPGYLDGLEGSLKQAGWEKTGPRANPRTYGLLWWRQDFVSNSNANLPNLATLVTPSHGYILRVFCSGKTLDDLQAAVKTMEGIRMKPDWSDGSEADVASPAPGKRVRVSSGVLYSNQTHIVDPEYPKEAREAGLRGGVFMRVLVGNDGSVKRLHVMEGDPKLAQAAIDAVHQWRYHPYLLNGQPVEVESVVWVEFK